MIHILWVKIVFFIRSLTSKLIARKQLFTKDDPKSDDDILKINPLDKKVCKKASLINVGTKRKFPFLVMSFGMSTKKSFERNV